MIPSLHGQQPTYLCPREQIRWIANLMEVILYSLVCEAIDQYLNKRNIHKDLKQEGQNISCAVQSVIEEEDKDEIISTLNAVSNFEEVTPQKMAQEQQKNVI